MSEMLKSWTWIQKKLVFSNVIFRPKNITTGMTYTTYLNVVFEGALVILGSSWYVCYTLDIALP